MEYADKLIVGDVVHVCAVVKFTTVRLFRTEFDTVPPAVIVTVDARLLHVLTVVPFARPERVEASLHI
jgi:hypothetical protein